MMDPKFLNILMAKDLADRDKRQKQQQQNSFSPYFPNQNMQQTPSSGFSDMWDWTKKKW